MTEQPLRNEQKECIFCKEVAIDIETPCECGDARIERQKRKEIKNAKDAVQNVFGVTMADYETLEENYPWHEEIAEEALGELLSQAECVASWKYDAVKISVGTFTTATIKRAAKGGIKIIRAESKSHTVEV